MTVTVRPRGETQMLVRANAQYMNQAVEEPKPYQDFFVSLEKSMFRDGPRGRLTGAKAPWVPSGEPSRQAGVRLQAGRDSPGGLDMHATFLTALILPALLLVAPLAGSRSLRRKMPRTPKRPGPPIPQSRKPTMTTSYPPGFKPMKRGKYILYCRKET